MNFNHTGSEQASVIVAPPESRRVIDVKGLNFFYDKNQALFNVDLPVARNEITALIGP